MKNKKTESSKENISSTEMQNAFEQAFFSFLKNDKKLDIDIVSLSDCEDVPFYINTGNYAFNWILSNSFYKGIPGTKIIELAGDNSSGKTLVLAQILGENLKQGGTSIVIDTEDAWTLDFTSKILGSKELASKIKIIKNLDTVEQLESFLIKMIDFKESSKDTTKILCAIDSVAQLTTEHEKEIVKNSQEKVDMGRAKTLKRLFRVLNRKLRNNNITIILTNHLITNIGTFFGPSKIPSGGVAVPYAAGIRILLSPAKEIFDTKTNHPIGIKLFAKTIKNRFAPRGRQATFSLKYKKGIDSLSGLLELLENYKIVKLSTKEIGPRCKVSYKDKEFLAKDLEEIIKQNPTLLDEFEKQLNNTVEEVESKLIYDDEVAESEFESEEQIYLS